MDIYSSGTDTLVSTPSWRDRLAERFFRLPLSRLRHCRVKLRLPSGYQFFAGKDDADTEIHWIISDWNALRRMAHSGALGFAEGYINGEWTTPDLPHLLTQLARELDRVEPRENPWAPSRLMGRLKHWRNANTKSGSKRNIEFHYDLGNAFYTRWLDPSMTYSSALFEPETLDLEAAQTRKYRHLCEQLQLKPGQHVLEVGCGWGGFAEIAARDFGCKVTGITLSNEQHAYARERMARAGLSDQVEIRIQDYRDVDERFDAIASIEMFEAVGEEHWPIYFNALTQVLKPGGRAGLQVITIREGDFERYRRNVDFIQKYIFPGGMLPPRTRLDDMAREAGLSPIHQRMFGTDYARTLSDWLTAFERAWPEIQPLGFDERFRLIWRYYLAYCEAGFATGRIDVGQFFYEKPLTEA